MIRNRQALPAITPGTARYSKGEGWYQLMHDDKVPLARRKMTRAQAKHINWMRLGRALPLWRWEGESVDLRIKRLLVHPKQYRSPVRAIAEPKPDKPTKAEAWQAYQALKKELFGWVETTI